MKKRIISFLVSIIMIFSITSQAYASVTDTFAHSDAIAKKQQVLTILRKSVHSHHQRT